MSFDYSVLTTSEDGVTNTWREIYDENIPLPVNLLLILQQAVFLPHDFYDLIAAYFLLPSALCNVVPYLFLHGASGSGKSTLAKCAKHLHGISFNSSSDTFAGIRNSLDQRRSTWVDVPDLQNPGKTWAKKVEKNTMMVWDDIDASVFANSPDLYRLLKFGYDRSTDKITVSSKEIGENKSFRCFCPKIFSTISPLHLDDRLKELKRRLIVIPCKRIEDIPDHRLVEMGISKDNWHSNLIKIDSIDWTGFSHKFQSYWNLEKAQLFVETRQTLLKSGTGLNSQQVAISTDLLSCGIASGIWTTHGEAVHRVKTYWDWFKQETETSGSLGQLLGDYLRAETRNMIAGGKIPEINASILRHQIKVWVEMGWLLEAPRGREIADLMHDKGWRFRQGKWSKE